MMLNALWTMIVVMDFSVLVISAARSRDVETTSNVMPVNTVRIHRVFVCLAPIVSMTMIVKMRRDVTKAVVSPPVVAVMMNATGKPPVSVVDVLHPSSVEMRAIALFRICSASITCVPCRMAVNPMRNVDLA